MRQVFRIGIDLGGSKIEAAAVDAAGAVAFRRRIATPTGDYAATIAAIATLVYGVEHMLGGTAPVGIGIPGAVSPVTGLVMNANSTWLLGRPLQVDLEAALQRLVRAFRTMPIASPCRRQPTAPPQARHRLRRHPGYRCRRRHRDRRSNPARRQRDRRRVGPQPAALAQGRRAAGAALLLRADRLRRNLPFGTWARRRPSPPDRTPSRFGGYCIARRGRGCRLPGNDDALCRSAGARPRCGYQSSRPGCDRPRRRALWYHRTL
jgi:ROK family